MEIIGKIIVALPEVGGVSKTGNNWKKREYVLETIETYPRKVHFDFFGERADQFPLNVGDEIKLSFDIESREYQGRWYTSIRGWKAEPANAAAGVPQQPGAQMYGGQAYPNPPQPQAPQYPQPAGAAPTMPEPSSPFGGQGNANDDLPF